MTREIFNIYYDTGGNLHYMVATPSSKCEETISHRWKWEFV